MALNFPASPTLNEVFITGGVTYHLGWREVDVKGQCFRATPCA